MPTAISSHINALKALATDRRRASVVVAGWLALFAGGGAIAFDYGRMTIDQRRAQAATNQAAVLAASNLMAAESAATAAVSAGGVAGNSTMTVVRGRYNHDPMVPKEERFKPDPLNANAARVTVTMEPPLQLGRVLTGSTRVAITTEATATRTAFGVFAVGSRTPTTQPGLLNQLLSGLLGARIDLDAADYSALAATRVDLFDFLSALASGRRSGSVSYDRIARLTLPVSDVIAALARAAQRVDGSETAASQALDRIAFAASRGADSIRVSTLFSPGPYGDYKAGQSPGGQSITVAALDILNATAQIGGGRRLVEGNFQPPVPGIAGATFKIAFGERPSGLSWIKVGFEGVNIQSTQTRLLLKVSLHGAGALSALEVPLVVDIANATAQLSSVRCNYMQPSQSTMLIDARPGPVAAWIGDITDFELTNILAAPRPAPGRIVDLPVLRVTGRSAIPIQTMHPNTLVFTQSDANMRLARSVGTREFSTILVTRLLRNVQFAIEKQAVSDSVPSAPTKAIAEMLTAAAPTVERTLATTLDAIGVGLGRAEVTPLGLRCDQAALVQ